MSWMPGQKLISGEGAAKNLESTDVPCLRTAVVSYLYPRLPYRSSFCGLLWFYPLAWSCRINRGLKSPRPAGTVSRNLDSQTGTRRATLNSELVDDLRGMAKESTATKNSNCR